MSDLILKSVNPKSLSANEDLVYLCRIKGMWFVSRVSLNEDLGLYYFVNNNGEEVVSTDLDDLYLIPNKEASH